MQLIYKRCAKIQIYPLIWLRNDIDPLRSLSKMSFVVSGTL